MVGDGGEWRGGEGSKSRTVLAANPLKLLAHSFAFRMMSSESTFCFCVLSCFIVCGVSADRDPSDGVQADKRDRVSDLCDLPELILEAEGQVGCPPRGPVRRVAHTHLYQIHTPQMAAEELLRGEKLQQSRGRSGAAPLAHSPTLRAQTQRLVCFLKECRLKSGFSSRCFCRL